MKNSEASLPIACVILPTYNEVENIQTSIDAIFAEQENITSHLLKIIVVDDNSPDGTQDVVRRCQEKYEGLFLLTGDKKGLGEAYKRGIAYALDEVKPDSIFQMDADGQHDTKLIPLFINLANHGFTLVIGSRFALGGSTPDFSFYRTLLSRVGNFMVRYLGGVVGIQDCTSGYRCIKADLFEKCNLNFLSTKGYSFQSSLLCELIRNNARTIEIPIVFPDRQHGESKLALSDQIEFLLNIVRIRFRNSEEFIKYGLVGASGVLVNMSVYLTLTRSFDWQPELASPVGIEISILGNFILNNFWTFRKRVKFSSLRKKLTKFHIAAGVSGFVNYTIFLFLMNLLGVGDIVANLVGIAVGVITNYSINSFWTWKRT